MFFKIHGKLTERKNSFYVSLRNELIEEMRLEYPPRLALFDWLTRRKLIDLACKASGISGEHSRTAAIMKLGSIDDERAKLILNKLIYREDQKQDRLRQEIKDSFGGRSSMSMEYWNHLNWDRDQMIRKSVEIQNLLKQVLKEDN